MGATTRGPLSPLVGWAILTVALLATVGGMGAPTLPVAGAFAWGLVPWLYPTLDRRQKRYVVLLFGLGVALGGVAEAAGLTVAWTKVLTQNTLLVAMLAAVTFLQLVAPASGASSGDKTQRPAPWRRLAQAATAVHLIGAVINLSMVVITAEQWLRRGFSSLPEAMARAVARGFLAAALWSPFFAAMAVALTYAPGASLLAIAQYGVPLAVLLLLWSVVELVQYTPEAELALLPDYPWTFRQLILPVAMLVVVLGLHQLWPEWSMIAVINTAALLLPLVGLLGRFSFRETARLFSHHVAERLPLMRGEFLLFLSAGFFAVGLEAWVPKFGSWLPFSAFTGWAAAATLAAMVLLAALGVHAVVTITLVSAWFAPLNPDPVLLAMIFLGTWAIGLAVNPLAGVHLLLEARFGLSALRLARGNWRYALGGYLLVVMTLLMRDALLSHQRESQVATASTAAEVQGSMTTASGQRAAN